MADAAGAGETGRTAAQLWADRLGAFADPRRVVRSPRLLLLRQLPGVHRGLFAISLLAVLLTAVMPTATTLASGALVGSVPAAVKHGLHSDAGRHLLRTLAVLSGVYTFQFAVLPLFNQATAALSRRLDRSLSERVMAAILAPTGIRHLEEPEILDEVTKAEGLVTGFTPGGALRGMVGIWSIRLGAVGGMALVARFSWLLAAGLAVVAVVEQRFWRNRFDEVTASIFDRGDRHRRSNYLRDTVLTPIAAKEVRVFGLQPWFASRFHSSWGDVMGPVWKQMRGNRLKSAAAATLPPAAIVTALAIITSAALDGRINLTALVVLTQAVFTISNLGAVGNQDEEISRGVAALPAALDLERRLQGPDFVSTGSADPAGLPQRAIRFEKVAFRYPGREHDVYDGLDLEIPAGRSLAVVGANGAGKTTLVKLLARMYEPTSGRITVDGGDVRLLDPAAWQTRIAAIFQDFRRYHLPARDNVAFGAPAIAGDQDALERAASRAGVLDLIEGLDGGWETPLDRQLTGGTDLSGGQWQRIALARALFAVEGGAGVLILDEPTASLDVRTESELYERFLDLTSGLTTVVISHRFSTVRRADCIVVLDQGRVVERGTHDELVALGGQYATMFELQASRYVDGSVDGDGAPEEVAVGG